MSEADKHYLRASSWCFVRHSSSGSLCQGPLRFPGWGLPVPSAAVQQYLSQALGCVLADPDQLGLTTDLPGIARSGDSAPSC